MSKVDVNGNFHVLNKSGKSPFELEKYQQYRRKWNENPEQRQVDTFPLHLDIELTAECNLKCPFCITTHADFPAGKMDVDLFKKIVDEGAEKGLYSLKLNWRGEPLMHPKMPELVRYAKEKGIIDVFMNTNATILTEKYARKVVESGIDRITVSFEGYEKELYESNRVGATFENTVENVKGLMRLKKELGSETPWVRVQTVLIDELKDKVAEYRAFWEEIVDEVAYIDMKNEVQRLVVGKDDWACPQLWQRLVISSDGQVMPCVNDHFCNMRLGNARDDSLADIWQSSKLTEMRQTHDAGLAHEIPGCSDCPLRSAQIMKDEVVDP